MKLKYINAKTSNHVCRQYVVLTCRKMDDMHAEIPDIWVYEEGKCGSRRGMTAERPGNDPRKIHFKQTNHSVHIALLSVCGGILPQMLNCFQNIIYYKPDKIIHMTNFEERLKT